jgi:hypothetical protein
MVRKSGGRPFIWAWSFVPAALETVLLPEPCIRVLTGHARSLDATYFRVPGRDEVHVHLLNSTVKTLNGDVLPIPGARLDIRDIGFTPATAEVVHPEQKALAVTRLDRRHVIELPPVAIHTIVRVSA